MFDYAYYIENRISAGEDEYSRIYFLESSEKYRIKEIKQRATRWVSIKLTSHGVIWCERRAFGRGRFPGAEEILVTQRNFANAGERAVIVISGEPREIVGLDDGGYVSASRTPNGDDVIVFLSE